jgi:hypothetical protein
MGGDNRRVPPRNQRGRQPHHIANIAHHFLGDEPVADPGTGHSPYFVAIGAAGQGAVAARVCAQLAGLLPADQVALVETGKQPWSARQHLSPGCWLPVAASGDPTFAAAGALEDLLYWRPGQDPEDSVHSAAPRLILQNLGVLNNSQLSRFEAALTASSRRLRPLGPCDHLVWCLPDDECLELGTAYTLGRVLHMVRPAQLEILLLQGVGDSLAVSGSPPDQAELTERCRLHLAAVGQGVGMHISHLRLPAEGDSAAESWTAICRRIGRHAGHLSD